MKNKNYYYIGVWTARGMKLVTEIDNSTKSARWESDKAPLCLSKAVAEDICWSLCMNFCTAVVIHSLWEIDKQYFEVSIPTRDKEDIWNG